MTTCKHWWKLVGTPGRRWYRKHALAKCVHCGAWTVVEYGLPPGPCGHTVGTIPVGEEWPESQPVYRNVDDEEED